MAAAGSFRGRKFGILVASSLVATSVIVGAAFTGTGHGPLAALLGTGLAAGGPSSSDGTANPLAPGGPSGPTSLPPPPAGTSAVPVPAPAPSPAPSPAPAPAPGPSNTTPDDKAPTDPYQPPPTPQAGRIKHVFVLTLSSPGYEETFGEQSQMPYLSETLRPQGELLSRYSLLDREALPNYIAAASGQPPNRLTRSGCPVYKEFSNGAKLDSKGRVVGVGCVYPVDALSLGDQFSSGGYVWHAYMEDMANEFGPANCVHPDSNGPNKPERGGYSANRNPFVYFHSLLDLGDCAINDVPLTDLRADIRKVDTTPNYSFISPNLCNVGVAGQCADGQPDGAAAADAFLQTWVPKITKSPAFKKDGLLVITFGDVDSPAGTKDPTRVGALLLSPFVSTKTTLGARLDPYALLRTTEDLFGLAHLAEAGSAKTKSFAAPLLQRRRGGASAPAADPEAEGVGGPGALRGDGPDREHVPAPGDRVGAR